MQTVETSTRITTLDKRPSMVTKGPGTTLRTREVAGHRTIAKGVGWAAIYLGKHDNTLQRRNVPVAIILPPTCTVSLFESPFVLDTR